MADMPMEIAAKLHDWGMQCRCDLDNWQPTGQTQHSPVCPIHKEAMRLHRIIKEHRYGRSG